ncbi:hypothetical protein A584_06594 [Pseudomonas syringae pv. theae ICMP 3923]|uniref:Uncharacterized protein n=1 Tax=Pseudomonas syringae pv. theae TaxID=103985 RepID=A0A0Q0EII8_PSESX|nr:hypothetical protein IYO_018560 [Pseudomonas syringae pv. actinidiae ICMP 18884]AOE57867.1 hypothetical protein NZ708_18540 [Pseudomonas syringae pv. actinidiae ICMP 18708]EGH63508.1 hypothetical protein PSYAC_01070 [Pseudomonas syringae pv. actinidiae str. M302091]EPM55939.1 hypothetical protein A264_21494 [Pseudomonas syringae pv. actinidiae ICMP 19071]EPM56909.1 hypothetical protein A256_06153 [Pseudomonas syringae pv. actinidiae ICMP 19103]EPM61446.1 hypothetical protein A262_06259 [Pse
MINRWIINIRRLSFRVGQTVSQMHEVLAGSTRRRNKNELIFHWQAFFKKDLEIGGAPTSHTPAHNVPAVAASFRI